MISAYYCFVVFAKNLYNDIQRCISTICARGMCTDCAKCGLCACCVHPDKLSIGIAQENAQDFLLVLSCLGQVMHTMQSPYYYGYYTPIWLRGVCARTAVHNIPAVYSLGDGCIHFSAAVPKLNDAARLKWCVFEMIFGNILLTLCVAFF